MTLIDLLREQSLNVKYIDDQEYDPRWSDDELLSKVLALDCNNKGLTTLPSLPACEMLDCFNNQLTTLPLLPVCQELYVQYQPL